MLAKLPDTVSMQGRGSRSQLATRVSPEVLDVDVSPVDLGRRLRAGSVSVSTSYTNTHIHCSRAPCVSTAPPFFRVDLISIPSVPARTRSLG